MGVGEAAGRLIELGERKRPLQAETARALLPRNFNCSKKRGFRSPSVRAIRREQRLAKEPLQERVENPLSRVSGQPLSLPYAAQRSIRFLLSELNFGETSEEEGQIESMPLLRKDGEALTKLGEAAIAAFETRSRPGRDRPSRRRETARLRAPGRSRSTRGRGARLRARLHAASRAWLQSSERPFGSEHARSFPRARPLLRSPRVTGRARPASRRRD